MLFLLIIGSYIVIFEHRFMLRVHTFVVETHKILIVMLIPRKIIFSLFLLVGVCLYAQQKSFVSSYVRGNFYNRGRVATESLRASDDLILLNVHPNKDGFPPVQKKHTRQMRGY